MFTTKGKNKFSIISVHEGLADDFCIDQMDHWDYREWSLYRLTLLQFISRNIKSQYESQNMNFSKCLEISSDI